MISGYLFYFVFFGILFVFIPYRMMHFFESGRIVNVQVPKLYLWSARGLLVITLGLIYSLCFLFLSLLSVYRSDSEPSPYHPLLGVDLGVY